MEVSATLIALFWVLVHLQLHNVKAEDCEMLTKCIKRFSGDLNINDDFKDSKNIEQLIQHICGNSQSLYECYSGENLRSCSVFSTVTQNVADRAGENMKHQINSACSQQEGFIDMMKCMRIESTLQNVQTCAQPLYVEMKNAQKTNDKEKSCMVVHQLNNCMETVLKKICTAKSALAFTAISRESMNDICSASSLLGSVFMILLVLLTRIVL